MCNCSVVQESMCRFVTLSLGHVPKPFKLRKVALHILTMFGSTYNCEAAFSTMNIIKTKYRSRLTNEYLPMCMRIALTPFKPRFKILARQARAQYSH